MFSKTSTPLDGAITSASAGSVGEGVQESKPELEEVEAPSTVRQFKVNGKTVSVDMANEAQVQKLLQLGLASGDKFQEASRLRKEAEDILSTAKTEKSAAKALKKAGFNDAEIREILEKELAGYYEEEALSPEEKARKAREAKLAEYERREKELEEQEQMTKREKEIAKEVENLEGELLGALEKSSLPRTPILAKWATQYMAAFDARGIELSPADAVRMVEQEFPQLISSVLSSSKDVGQLKELLGKDIVKKLLDDSVSAVKKAERPFTKEKSRESSPKADNESRKKENMSDYFERLRRGNL